MAIVISLILAFIVACLKFIVEGIFCDSDVKNTVMAYLLLWGYYTIVTYLFIEYIGKLMYQLARELMWLTPFANTLSS